MRPLPTWLWCSPRCMPCITADTAPPETLQPLTCWKARVTHSPRQPGSVFAKVRALQYGRHSAPRPFNPSPAGRLESPNPPPSPTWWVASAKTCAPHHSRHGAAHVSYTGTTAQAGGAQVADEDGRVRGFVVERGPGLEVHPVEGKLSLRASPTGNLHLASARGAVLPGSGGLKSALQCLTQAREVRPCSSSSPCARLPALASTQ